MDAAISSGRTPISNNFRHIFVFLNFECFSRSAQKCQPLPSWCYPILFCPSFRNNRFSNSIHWRFKEKMEFTNNKKKKNAKERLEDGLQLLDSDAPISFAFCFDCIYGIFMFPHQYGLGKVSAHLIEIHQDGMEVMCQIERETNIGGKRAESIPFQCVTSNAANAANTMKCSAHWSGWTKTERMLSIYFIFLSSMFYGISIFIRMNTTIVIGLCRSHSSAAASIDFNFERNSRHIRERRSYFSWICVSLLHHSFAFFSKNVQRNVVWLVAYCTTQNSQLLTGCNYRNGLTLARMCTVWVSVCVCVRVQCARRFIIHQFSVFRIRCDRHKIWSQTNAFKQTCVNKRHMFVQSSRI